jgi:hypothetical protein
VVERLIKEHATEAARKGNDPNATKGERIALKRWLTRTKKSSGDDGGVTLNMGSFTVFWRRSSLTYDARLLR